MRKPWSLSTTVRNPERILPFLRVLRTIEGELFDEDTQKKFQILLIQNRLYKPIGLNERRSDYYETLKDKMSFTEAEDIFEHMQSRSKELQKDTGLRGRTSVAPLTKMGLAFAKKSCGAVQITDLGNAFLAGDIDIGDVYFRFFIKWQIPNPDSNDYKLEHGYDIKPFIGILHLIWRVNMKSVEIGEKSKGLSKEEFSLFGPTLVNFKDIDSYAEEIIHLRKQKKGKSKKIQRSIFKNYKREFAKEFLKSSQDEEINRLLQNLKDYGDNAIRYFRLSRYFYIRGSGFYIDIEPRRSVEVENLLKFDSAQSDTFKSKEDYLNYIADISQPQLPWETKEKFMEIISKLVKDIKFIEEKNKVIPITILTYKNFDNTELKSYISKLRQHRRSLQEEENHQHSQNIKQVNDYIGKLENIFDFDDRPILLEKLSTLGLNALNDALRIKPNYPVGDDNEPTFTAPANTPDIECYYKDFNAICEVTMLTGRNQWYNEGQPVMRHLRDFENKYPKKKIYCIFIAPTLHRDTVNTFWTAIKYEYEGKTQNIVPLTLDNFIKLLKILVEMKMTGEFLKHEEIARLYDSIIEATQKFSDSNEWLNHIPKIIDAWQKNSIYN